MIRFPSPTLVVPALALLIAFGGAGYSATGGNFILGKSNTATTRTTLSAPVDRSLQLINTSTAAGATALGLAVPAGHPPMIVNSQTTVANLSADRLDGLNANQLVRVGRGTNNQFGSGVTFTDAATITLTIPQAGFVLLSGNVTADSSACGSCYLHVLFRDKGTGDVSPVMVQSVVSNNEEVVSGTWVFPVTAGQRTFALQTGPSPSDAAIIADNPTITALYIPFGPKGTLELSGGFPQSASYGSARLGPARSDGARAVQH